MEQVACPRCRQALGPQDVQCPHCELLVEKRLAAPPPKLARPTSVVQALMMTPQGSTPAERPAPDPEPANGAELLKTTRRFVAPPRLDAVVPKVTAGLTLQNLNLTPFEAFVVFAIDGYARGNQLAAMLDIAEIELAAVLYTLSERGVVFLEPVVTPPPKPRPAPPVAARAPEVTPIRVPERQVVVQKLTPPPAAVRDLRIGLGATAKPEVLDALRQVRTRDATSSPGVARPDTAESMLQQAIRLEQTGKAGEVIGFLERALAKSPDAAPLLNRLAVVLVRDRRDYAEAERLLRRATELAPQSDVYRKNLMTVLTAAAR